MKPANPTVPPLRLPPSSVPPRRRGKVARGTFAVCCAVALLWLARHEGTLPAAEPQATPADQIKLPEGFAAELLYSVPRESQGSWVSLAVDPRGRLIASDQYGKLYRVTPPAIGGSAEATRVEPLAVDAGTAHGLLYAFDSLYVVAGEREQGLYRLRDTDGDDQFDQKQLLRRFKGGGEHGPHAVVLSPDGKSLYLCAGNHTDLPALETSRVPRNWGEDQLLPRMWDAGGHAVGKLAPGGWICRTDPEGKSFELVSSGYRNEFDIAFGPDAELFTFDADMEWDIGTPWYRPTRICHATSGSEFGWRSGTGKWPADYPDSLPPVVDIGPGSPTGVTFAYQARFPARYQHAMFVADWSYGLLYAVHLEPHGASFRGTFEQFATASPLPITDLVVNPHDGALYFAIGGRRTQSGLYRITYTGDDSTEPVPPQVAAGRELRQLRRRLESLHVGDHPEAVSAAWEFLDHEDRFIRYAARIAIEHRPVAEWRERALAERRPRALLEACIALARNGAASDQPGLVAALERLDWEELQPDARIALLRAYGLTFIRQGPPNAEIRESVLARLNPHYPAERFAENRELSRLLVYLAAPDVVARTLALLDSAPTQHEQLHYVLVLRTLKSGWTLPQRRRYFTWFLESGGLSGGHSFAGFLNNIRSEAIATLGASEAQDLAELLNAKPAAPETPEAAARPFVQKWSVPELLPSFDAPLRGRDFDRGRELFAAATCFKCHRFAGEGGIIGPDLTGVGRRFSNQYLLESLIEPSKAVSDQYQATAFQLADGRTVVGKVANLSGDRLMVITNMLEPGKMASVPRGEIEEQRPSPISMMPEGLIDTLKREEILDLLAYLKSGGNRRDPMFSPAAE